MNNRFMVNSFNIPNAVIDEVMPILSDAALRCYLVITRQTTGWQKTSDCISISQFMAKTGKSRNTVIKGCNELENLGLIIKITDENKSSEYTLNLSKICTSSKSEPVQNMNGGSSKSKQEVVQNLTKGSSKSEHTKDTIQNTIKNTIQNTPIPPQGNDGEKSPKINPDILAVFEHWKNRCNHPKAKLDTKRHKAIKLALSWGYSVEDLRQAIDGCSLTPFNRGQNDRGQVYDGLHIILRNADQVDRFMANAVNPPKSLNKQQSIEASNMAALQRYEAMKAEGQL